MNTNSAVEWDVSTVSMAGTTHSSMGMTRSSMLMATGIGDTAIGLMHAGVTTILGTMAIGEATMVFMTHGSMVVIIHGGIVITTTDGTDRIIMAMAA